LPIAMVFGTTLEAAPRGILAAAVSLQRGTSNIPDKDKEQAKAHLDKYYEKMQQQFDDKTIVPPWDDGSMAAIGHYEIGDALFLLGQKMTEGMNLDDAKAAFLLIGVEPKSLTPTVDVGSLLLDAEIALFSLVEP